MTETAPEYREMPGPAVWMDQDTFAGMIETIASERSPDVAELAKSLAAAQLEITNAEAGTENEFLNSRYANLAAVMEVCRQPLAKHGLSVVSMPQQAPEGLVILETMLLHESGQYLSSTWAMRPVKADPQGVGSVLTYMRRYSVSAMLGIAQYDDDANRAQPGKGEYERIAPEEADAILEVADNLFGAQADEVVSRMLDKVFSTSDCVIDKVTDIPAGQHPQAIKLLQNQAKREQAKKPAKASK